MRLLCVAVGGSMWQCLLKQEELEGSLELEGKGATLPRMWGTESALRAK